MEKIYIILIILIILHLLTTLESFVKESFANPSDNGNLQTIEKRLQLENEALSEKDPSKLLKSLKISTIPTVTTFSYIILSGIVLYDKEGKVITNWYNKTMAKNLDATVFSDPRLFIQKDNNGIKSNDALPSKILIDNLGFNFGMLDSVYIKKDNKNKYPSYKPFRLLSNKLVPDKYNFPSIPKNDWYGNHRFFDFLEIKFNKDLQLTIDDISRIDIIHALRRDGEIKDQVTDSIYLDKNAYMITKNNLELINYLDQSLLKKKIGEGILKISNNEEKANLNRLYTKIIL